jgi:hypothetical protein
MDLFVRAGRRDNLLIEELVAPASAGVQLGRRVPFRGVVVDAPTAVAQPDLREAAEAAGLPFMVDPLTTLLQDVQAPDSSWANLPFAQAETMDASELALGTMQDELIDRSIRFQIDNGASVITPPYFYMQDPTDPWFKVQLSSNRRTAAYLAQEGITLPVAPVLAASLRKFGVQSAWSAGVDEFLRSVQGMNLRHIGLALSSSRSQNGDTEDRLSAYLGTVAHLAAKAPVMAWRQGQYGLAAVAAGAMGYQTGPGTDERCDLANFARRRRPKPEGVPGGFGTTRFIYTALFGRSFPEKAAAAMLENRHLKASLVCIDSSCCPGGASSMVDDWRQHALRTRGRQLDELRAMPDNSWRLNAIATQSDRAATTARTANEVLEAAGVRERIPERSFRSLATVAEAMRRNATRRASTA